METQAEINNRIAVLTFFSPYPLKINFPNTQVDSLHRNHLSGELKADFSPALS